ncbi:winged helix-turn-helix domain-containing protein [Methanolobus mangrovi]|uniref:Winged helix-turn-helix domain-containing protein n=1 Tax=Methanolobus mangrovi TaxID=3072977 RepID=A0AA51UHQ6_9EURY|nr:winged helix-turn-helix domain-containing protein [Methanolobus mangrovi]WMW23198.1 winged helix-turn-helix domain-containing protein [Methanolobus mangrovi]
MDALLKSLKTTRQALLPQMKILEEHYLVIHYNDTYELTTIGNLIIGEMMPLLDTVDLFENDIDYWGTHNLSFIPPHLLQCIDKLRKCKVITPHHVDMYKLNEEILETSPISKSHYGIVTFYHPLFLQFISNLISNNVKVHMIVPQSVIDKFETEQSSQFEKIMLSELVHFSVYPEDMGFLGMACNDHYFMMRILKSNGEHDTRYILCNDRAVLEWGKELFEHYQKDSTPITDI